MGVNLAAMYNVSYKFRAGIALDWVYDASANVFVLSDPGTSQGFVEPPFNAQIALGASGRMEYVMPYFTVGIGMGANILHRGGDLRSFYQMLILKISMTRNTFLHVGYNLKDFRDPKVFWYAPESKWVMIESVSGLIINIPKMDYKVNELQS